MFSVQTDSAPVPLRGLTSFSLESPPFSVRRDGNVVRLEWTGCHYSIEQAPSVEGPWTRIDYSPPTGRDPAFVSCAIARPIEGGVTFYRLNRPVTPLRRYAEAEHPSLSAEDGAASSAHRPVCGAEVGSGPDRALAADSIDSRLKAFHHYGIDAHAEGYLVWVFDAVRTGGAKQEVLIRATIVDPIRGERRTGDRMTFTRVSDSEAGHSYPMHGGLFFVFLGRSADADATVDPQDPNAFWEYSSELSRVVELHRMWANSPANAGEPHSGSADALGPARLASALDQHTRGSAAWQLD